MPISWRLPHRFKALDNWRKVLRWTIANKIKVTYVQGKSNYNGVISLIPENVTIFNVGARSELFTFHTLTHELGHAIDFFELGYSRELKRAVSAMHTDPNKVTQSEALTIIQAEKRAWQKGNNLLDSLAIPSGPSYATRARASLRWYKKILLR